VLSRPAGGKEEADMATFVGTNGNNTIDGTGFQTIFGLGGHDAIDSDPNISNSEIYGGDGNDTIDLLSPGSGFVDGGAGNDIINGSNSADALYGSSGDDMIDSVAGDDFVDGGDGNDAIVLGNGGVAVGGAGNDTIVAGTFSSTTTSAQLFGGAGNDTIDARGVAATTCSAKTATTFSLPAGTAEPSATMVVPAATRSRMRPLAPLLSTWLREPSAGRQQATCSARSRT
jgi:Ca2+-binding RTX toxin-like protein